ncbi:MAG TPA: cobalamin biosynthesis protein CobQ, partial [Patescibacteria group bacterium]|nr:cobalamin biosynthesis protein CobQ [Patescibacteria group bacterium]
MEKNKTKRQPLTANRYSLTIGWLYPDLMNTYGDRGNIIVLRKRAEWRGIDVEIKKISVGDSQLSIVNCQLLFMGGAQDTQQEIVNEDLQDKKGKVLIEKIEDGTPGLYICGAYQFLGKYYKTADGKKLPGLGVFPLHTENPGESARRLIGNITAVSSWGLGVSELTNSQEPSAKSQLVGFENHGGRTYLEDPKFALATVEKGYGNNGEDGTEGIAYKNS